MKRTFLWCLLATCAGGISVHAQNSKSSALQVKANIKGLAAGQWLYYGPANEIDQKRDSVKTKPGGFAFTINIPEGKGDIYRLQLAPLNDWRRRTTVYLEAGTLVINGSGPDFKDIQFSGSAFAQDQARYNRFTKVYSDRLTERLKQTKPDGKLDKKDTVQLFWSSIEGTKAWIKDHPSSRYSTALLGLYYFSGFSFIAKDTLLDYFSMLHASARHNIYGAKLASELVKRNELEKITGIGKTAPDFIQPDTAGHPATLKELRGKYVLLDFWASWCVPCRKENKNVVKAYNKFRNDNFTVLSVSLEKAGTDARAKWLRAIGEDSLTWLQVADLKEKNTAAELYGVSGIPANFLIDPNGVIIARNLRGDDLERKLKEVLKTNTTSPIQKFNITGQIKGQKDRVMAYLNYSNETGVFKDSCIVRNGRFAFTGSFTGMMEARIKLEHVPGRYSPLNKDVTQMFYLEPGTITVLSATDSIKYARIKGGALNEVNNQYQSLIRPAMTRSDRLWTEILAKTTEERKDPDFIKANKARRAAIEEEIRSINRQFYKDHPNSYVGLVAFKEFVDVNNNLQATETAFNRFSPDVKNTWLGKIFASQIAGARNTQAGEMAMDFTQNDVNGKPVKLSDFRGKYVLLDFWASWCLPCRKENPYLVQAYNEYKGKNFTVLSVSLDKPDGRNAWLKAIEKDSLTWTHVSDLRYWDNAVAVLYGIKSVPANYLIDPNGIIIGRNLRGEELLEKLSKLELPVAH